MSKYVLKIDFPLAKAGSKIALMSKGCVPFSIFSSGTVDVSEEYLEQFIAEGWIEEVKPREWIMSKNDLDSHSYPAEAVTIKNLIKVCEVIE